MIHDLESSSLLIEAHRAYLRSLYHARSVSAPTGHSRQSVLGTLWRQIDRKLRGRRATVHDTPLRPSSGVA